ncbi:hypothetical protein Tco_1229041 [Tanacetum coccineum]
MEQGLYLSIPRYMAVQFTKDLDCNKVCKVCHLRFCFKWGQDVFVLNIGLDKEEHKMIADLLRVKTSTTPDASDNCLTDGASLFLGDGYQGTAESICTQNDRRGANTG